jgi:membrane-associated phospholipid phosphatase
MLFVDRPVALYVVGLGRWRMLFQAMAGPSLLALPVAGVVLLGAMVWRMPRVWVVMSAAVLAGTAAKDELKWVFGRPWPGTWLHYGVYTFHPFINSSAFGAFPSGHTAYIAAPLCVAWVLLPRWRVVWAAGILSVMVGLVGANYHFVGDVLGGLLTGIFCAWGSLRLVPERNKT